MFEYVRRGITRRKRQTAIIAIGMALAVAAVMVISAASSGIAVAQSKVLQSVYGVGTDLTITSQPSMGSFAQSGSQSGDSGNRVQFGPQAGHTGSDGNTTIQSTQVSVERGTQTMSSNVLTEVAATSGVSAATGTLALNQTDFSGTIQQQSGSGSSGSTTQNGGQNRTQGMGGGPDGGGFGGGNFDINRTTILGVDPTVTEAGPLSDMTVSTGSLLTKNSADSLDAVISASYATDNSLKVGSSITLGDSTKVTVVGILSESSSQSASDIYIPLALAQKISDEDGKVTTIYVKAASADNVDTLAASLTTALPDNTVSTQSDLANSISGSLSSAASWISGFGKWLTIGILALAFILAALFTISSVSRRTRELGTLKAIGWSNARVTANVVGETLIQSVLGALVGLLIGVAAIVGVNSAGITLAGATSSGFSAFGGGNGGGPGGNQPTATATTGTSGNATNGSSLTGSTQVGSTMPGGGRTSASRSSTTTILSLSPTPESIGLAVGAALLGGVVAGAAGAVATSRLRPAAALRAVE